MMSLPPYAVEMDGLSKSYGGVYAIQDLTFSIEKGTFHSLCGENGAGKSTLIKCLSGNAQPDRGRVLIDGVALEMGSVLKSIGSGIAVIHQETTIFPDLNPIQNIFAGREWVGPGSILKKKSMAQEAGKWLDRLDLEVDLSRPCGELPLAQRQLIAIARALSMNCRILILDEPTASMSAGESSNLLRMLNSLRAEGVTILFVSHRLDEVMEMSDNITVLRDGTHVGTRQKSHIDKPGLIRLMAGRSVEVEPGRTERIPSVSIPAPVLEVQGLCSAGTFQDIEFSLLPGEIVGLAGLVGAGRSELAKAIFGVDTYSQGKIKINSRPLEKGNVRESIRQGLAFVPEDRQHEGLILPLSIGRNMNLAISNMLPGMGILDKTSENRRVENFRKELDIRMQSGEVPVESLSGGNQQKVVLAKWLATQPKVFILDEPTRGVDVRAKSQVHQIIRELAHRGLAVLVISSDFPEILSLTDRILVMCEGKLTAQLTTHHATQESILRHAFPQSETIS